MIVNRKLFWLDMILLALVFTLIFLKPGKLSDALTGGIAALFVISFANHVRHYITYKKFY
ncbi:MAG TPA: hypothetical protein VGH64_01875 [Puia sp.]|jgi:hypothetical protein